MPIEAGVLAMADDVWAWCEETGARGRTVTVKLKWADFEPSTRSRTLEAPIKTKERLHAVAIDLVRSPFPPPKGVRLVGVTLANFRPRQTEPGEELRFEFDAPRFAERAR